MKRVRRYIAIALALLVAIPIIVLVIGCLLCGLFALVLLVPAMLVDPADPDDMVFGHRHLFS